jgi:hypothetical protein
MLVDPGQYKIFIEAARQQRFLLIDSVKVEAGRKTIVNADPLVGYVQVIPVEGDGFPSLGDVYLAAGGTDESSLHNILQRTSEIGVPMLISPGEYDVLCTPGVGRSLSLKRNASVSAGQMTVVDARESVAAIVLRDPQMAGLDLDSIFVIKTGTDTSGLFHYVQTTDAFGKAMLVGANGPYDVLIRPKGGQLVTIAKNVTPKAGAVSYVGGN